MAAEARRSRWRNLFVMPDSGSLVYWISKIKVPLSHQNGRADRLRHSDPSRHGDPRHAESRACTPKQPSCPPRPQLPIDIHSRCLPLVFAGHFQFYVIEFLNHIAPLSEWILGGEGYLVCSVLFPLVQQVRPEDLIVLDSRFDWHL